MSAGAAARLRLGVLVPCRNEAEVVGRKIANLALVRWPAGVLHRIVVVDDHSTDETRARATAAIQLHFGSRRDVRAAVVANGVRPGKPGAIAAGLALLEFEVDVVVLTDADVVIEPGALEALAGAFAGDPRLAMACGAQRFVRDLEPDRVDASEAFDRWTARVRSLESRSGRLFSVHGQLLAWRANLRLRPRAGIAADDLDLMLQVRMRSGDPRRVEIVPGAVFLEIKPPRGHPRRVQALRRARAYVQLVRGTNPVFPDAASRIQWLFYRRVPLAAPALTALVPVASIVLAWWLLGPGASIALALAFTLCLTSAPGWRWVQLALLIRAAAREESRGAVPEQWEMARR